MLAPMLTILWACGGPGGEEGPELPAPSLVDPAPSTEVCRRRTDSQASLDEEFARTWSCDQQAIERYWRDLGLGKSDWTRFGAATPCDLDLPLGRTLNALAFVDHFQDVFRRYRDDRIVNYRSGDVTGSLPFAGYELLTRIDGISPSCDDGGNLAVTNGVTRRMTVNTRLFYDFNVVQRAAILIHEARHTEGKVHNRTDRCPAGDPINCDHHFAAVASCPSLVSDDGGYAYEVKFLWDWGTECRDECTPPQAIEALMAAQRMLDIRFSEPPAVRAWPPPPSSPDRTTDHGGEAARGDGDGCRQRDPGRSPGRCGSA
jgi:hypothetical protein